jgi:hypothetical protein
MDIKKEIEFVKSRIVYWETIYQQLLSLKPVQKEVFNEEVLNEEVLKKTDATTLAIDILSKLDDLTEGDENERQHNEVHEFMKGMLSDEKKSVSDFMEEDERIFQRMRDTQNWREKHEEQVRKIAEEEQKLMDNGVEREEARRIVRERLYPEAIPKKGSSPYLALPDMEESVECTMGDECTENTTILVDDNVYDEDPDNPDDIVN